MDDERIVRVALWLSVPLNAAGALILAFPSSALGEALGLPGGVPPLYRALCALFIGLFGAAYVWLLRQPRIDRPLVGFAAVVKTSVFAVFLSFWLSDAVSNLGLLMVLPHLLVAIVFFGWLRRRNVEA